MNLGAVYNVDRDADDVNVSVDVVILRMVMMAWMLTVVLPH